MRLAASAVSSAERSETPTLLTFSLTTGTKERSTLSLNDTHDEASDAADRARFARFVYTRWRL